MFFLDGKTFFFVKDIELIQILLLKMLLTLLDIHFKYIKCIFGRHSCMLIGLVVFSLF